MPLYTINQNINQLPIRQKIYSVANGSGFSQFKVPLFLTGLKWTYQNATYIQGSICSKEWRKTSTLHSCTAFFSDRHMVRSVTKYFLSCKTWGTFHAFSTQNIAWPACNPYSPQHINTLFPHYIKRIYCQVTVSPCFTLLFKLYYQSYSLPK